VLVLSSDSKDTWYRPMEIRVCLDINLNQLTQVIEIRHEVNEAVKKKDPIQSILLIFSQKVPGILFRVKQTGIVT
jgi:hypothetical protein